MFRKFSKNIIFYYFLNVAKSTVFVTSSGNKLQILGFRWLVWSKINFFIYSYLGYKSLPIKNHSSIKISCWPGILLLEM